MAPESGKAAHGAPLVAHPLHRMTAERLDQPSGRPKSAVQPSPGASDARIDA
jgi:hypothetical protein